MFRRNGNILLTILFLLIIFIFVNRNTNVVVIEESTETPPNLPIIIDGQFRTKRLSPTKDFNVYGENCKIPRIDPFAAEVMRILKPHKFIECSDQPNVFTTRYDQKKNQYIVKINDSLIFSLYPKISDFDCSSQEIVRGPKDSLIWKNNSTVFTRDWIVPHRVQGAVIECFEFNQRSRTLQRDAFAFIQNPSDRNDSSDAKRSLTHPHVIMLGIGSMSQMNFQRTMPLTSKFVRQQGWYEMLGYNRIGDSTFVNLFSLLSGRTPRQWRQYCNVWKPGCLDSLTYLWNHFHNSGYLTAFAEDSSVFGFMKPPVDYYLHPVLEVFDKILGRKRRLRQDDCLGRRRRFRYVLDYALELVKRFVHDSPKPLFGVFWMNSFSRDDFSAAANVDEEFVGYLHRFKELGLFEKAIVVLFSDQGQHRGPLMKLQSSFLEERLPMLHIYLPPWYRKLYPEAGQALGINRRRLSSTFDVNFTLKKILLQPHPSLVYERVSTTCNSLFEVIPNNRSCEDALIDDSWCTCEPYSTEAISPEMRNLAKAIIFHMNKYLTLNDLSNSCRRLKLANLVNVERKQNLDAKGNTKASPNSIEKFRVRFTTSPEAFFQGTIIIDRQGNLIDIPEGDIERLNAHRVCVNSLTTSKFCVCRT